MKLRSLILNLAIAAALTPVAVSLVSAQPTAAPSPRSTVAPAAQAQPLPAAQSAQPQQVANIDPSACRKVRVVHAGYGEAARNNCGTSQH